MPRDNSTEAAFLKVVEEMLGKTLPCKDLKQKKGGFAKKVVYVREYLEKHHPQVFLQVPPYVDVDDQPITVPPGGNSLEKNWSHDWQTFYDGKIAPMLENMKAAATVAAVVAAAATVTAATMPTDNVPDINVPDISAMLFFYPDDILSTPKINVE